MQIDQLDLDPKLGKDVIELGIGAPLKIISGNNLISLLSHVDNRVKDTARS